MLYRYMMKGIKAFFVWGVCYILSDLLFAFGIKIWVQMFFLFMLLGQCILAADLIIMLIYNLRENGLWAKNDRILHWFVRTSLIAMFCIDMTVYVLPKVVDLPLIFNADYRRITGKVIAIDYSSATGRYARCERIQYVSIQEQKTDKIVKVVYHGNNLKADYQTKNIWYLPATHWGIDAD